MSNEDDRFAPARLSDPDAVQVLRSVDVDYMRWTFDTKVRALSALCSLECSGKGNQTSRDHIETLSRQIVSLGDKTQHG